MTPSFTGSIPALYDRLLVPMIFEPYAVDLASRVRALTPGAVLELAAGTGVVTRQLALQLPQATSLAASDLSQPMLDRAADVGTARPVTWQQADAMALPYDDASFDVVTCQFGAMFFPDKGKAFGEARRVLRPRGTFVFNVWGRLQDNELVSAVDEVLATEFPSDRPTFMQRIPHGYFDEVTIKRDLAAGGFVSEARYETLPLVSRAATPKDAAVAYCQATPMRAELEERAPGRLDELTDKVAGALALRFGPGPILTRILAHVITVTNA